MTTLFTIDLTINMPDSGRHARKLFNLYLTDMPADINEVAYDLCGANAAVQARKFTKLTLKRSEVWSDQEGSLRIFAHFAVSGEDPGFIKKVFDKYMESYPTYLKKATGAYFSHDSLPPDFIMQPTDWSAEVHKA
jgi:hypothetical protein